MEKGGTSEAWGLQPRLFHQKGRYFSPISVQFSDTQALQQVLSAVENNDLYGFSSDLDVDRSLSRKYNGITVRFVNLKALIKVLKDLP